MKIGFKVEFLPLSHLPNRFIILSRALGGDVVFLKAVFFLEAIVDQ